MSELNDNNKSEKIYNKNSGKEKDIQVIKPTEEYKSENITSFEERPSLVKEDILPIPLKEWSGYHKTIPVIMAATIALGGCKPLLDKKYEQEPIEPIPTEVSLADDLQTEISSEEIVEEVIEEIGLGPTSVGSNEDESIVEAASVGIDREEQAVDTMRPKEESTPMSIGSIQSTPSPEVVDRSKEFLEIMEGLTFVKLHMNFGVQYIVTLEDTQIFRIPLTDKGLVDTSENVDMVDIGVDAHVQSTKVVSMEDLNGNPVEIFFLDFHSDENALYGLVVSKDEDGSLPIDYDYNARKNITEGIPNFGGYSTEQREALIEDFEDFEKFQEEKGPFVKKWEVSYGEMFGNKDKGFLQGLVRELSITGSEEETFVSREDGYLNIKSYQEGKYLWITLSYSEELLKNDWKEILEQESLSQEVQDSVMNEEVQLVVHKILHP